MRIKIAGALLASLCLANAFVSQNGGFLASRSTLTPETCLSIGATVAPPSVPMEREDHVDEISTDRPLQVMIAGAGVGGLALAKVLSKNPLFKVTVIEQTSEFKRFGGPIQLASNAMEIIRQMDQDVYDQIAQKFTITGDKINGIKDGIRTEWYAKFDLKGPAESRNMPYTGVIDRPDLQEIYLDSLPAGTVRNGDALVSYQKTTVNGVQAILSSGQTLRGDVLIGADGIWSAVRATMRGGAPRKGDGSGATYSGYTLFAGELAYDSPDKGQVGYKVYIGPGQVRQMHSWLCSLCHPEILSRRWVFELTNVLVLAVLCRYRHWQGRVPMVCLFGASSRFGYFHSHA